MKKIFYLIGTEILHFVQLRAEKIDFEVLQKFTKFPCPDFRFCKCDSQTLNEFFYASNWSKCKISVPIERKIPELL